MRAFASLVVLACAGCAASTPRALVVFETPKQEPKSDAKPEPAPKQDDAWHGHIPIGFWDTGICLGNSKDWNGIRLNWMDAGLGTINGVNFTLWKPDGDVGGTVNGVGLGIVGNGADQLNGAFASLIVNGAGKDLNGVHLAGIVNGAGRSVTGVGGALIVNGAGASVTGVHFGGLINGAGVSLTGVNAALLVNGAGADQTGVNIAGIVSGAGLSTTGVTGSLIVTGAGKDATGLTFGGIVAGAGRDMTGINLALGKVKGGRNVRGITIGGAFIESGGHDERVDAALDQMKKDIEGAVERGEDVGPSDLKNKVEAAKKAEDEGAGDPGSIAGIALTAFRARAGSMTGLIAALGNLTTDEFTGLGISLCTQVEKSQSGVTFGAFNHAEKIDGFGFQLGLLNHIPTNPTWARWLPLVNWQM